MEFNGLVLLAALWFLLSLIGRAGRASRPPAPRPPAPRPPRPDFRQTVRDPTQQEGSRLELMLGELQRTLESAGAASGQGGPLGASEPRGMEDAAARPERRLVDQDDDAEALVARRIRAAARDDARAPAHHAAFDERIGQQPADHTGTQAYTVRQLRDAVVWREILGPPVSER